MRCCAQVGESLQALVDIVGAFEESYDTASGRASVVEFAPVLAAAIDPVIDMCERSAEALTPNAPSRRAAKIDSPLAAPVMWPCPEPWFHYGGRCLHESVSGERVRFELWGCMLRTTGWRRAPGCRRPRSRSTSSTAWLPCRPRWPAAPAAGGSRPFTAPPHAKQRWSLLGRLGSYGVPWTGRACA